MSISVKTRKILWAKSGNCCAICKTELIHNSNEVKSINIGDECHIISKEINGPRHKPDYEDYDTYENLLLLCKNHHREVDENFESFSEEVLTYIKLTHENWVNERLKVKSSNNKGSFLLRIKTGNQLLSILSDTHASRTSWDEVETKEESELLSSFFGELIDYIDILDSVEPSEKINISFQLKQLLDNLDKNGFSLFAEKTIEKMKFQDSSTDNWGIATIVAKRKIIN